MIDGLVLPVHRLYMDRDGRGHFTFGDDKISMEEYEKLRKEIFGW